MAAKLIKATAVTGQLVYAVIRRDADGFLLDDADGSFSASPTDLYFDLPEDGTVKGLYLASENRIPWDNGSYAIIPYIQTGGSPAIALDLPGEAEEMLINGDAEVTLTTLGSLVVNINAAINGSISSTKKVILASLDEILKQIRLLLSHILDLEKRILRKDK